MIDFQTDPERYCHWRIRIDEPIAYLSLDVDESGGLFDGYELKLNSYDLGVDIELHDAVQRLRFQHPGVRAVVLESAKDRVFCAGANIRMLAGASHVHKVNFCKFTNETRNAIEDASAHSGQVYLAAVNGACAGGGYELALAADHILLVDDGTSSVSLPEVSLLAVLPGTGGVTRVTDKRLVRRDRADLFCSTEEGVRGGRAVEWGLVDEVVPASGFADAVRCRALDIAARSDRPANAAGIHLGPLHRTIEADRITYSTLLVSLEPAAGRAAITIIGPDEMAPGAVSEVCTAGDQYWPLRMARELDDALLHMRFNEPEIGIICIGSVGDPGRVLAHDGFLAANAGHWLVREMMLYWTRVLSRVDLTSRSLVALIDPGSCFAGFLAELVFAADRSYMFDGRIEGDNRPEARLVLSSANFGQHPMLNGLSRVATRFLGDPERLRACPPLRAVCLTLPKPRQWGWSPEPSMKSIGTKRCDLCLRNGQGFLRTP